MMMLCRVLSCGVIPFCWMSLNDPLSDLERTKEKKEKKKEEKSQHENSSQSAGE